MAIASLNTQNGINFGYINQHVYEGLRSQEANLRNTLESIGAKGDGNITPTDLIALQQQVQQWTMMVDIQSTITKQVSDSLRSVIQKAA